MRPDEHMSGRVSRVRAGTFAGMAGIMFLLGWGVDSFADPADKPTVYIAPSVVASNDSRDDPNVDKIVSNINSRLQSIKEYLPGVSFYKNPAKPYDFAIEEPKLIKPSSQNPYALQCSIKIAGGAAESKVSDDMRPWANRSIDEHASYLVNSLLNNTLFDEKLGPFGYYVIENAEDPTESDGLIMITVQRAEKGKIPPQKSLKYRIVKTREIGGTRYLLKGAESKYTFQAVLVAEDKPDSYSVVLQPCGTSRIEEFNKLVSTANAKPEGWKTYAVVVWTPLDEAGQGMNPNATTVAAVPQ